MESRCRFKSNRGITEQQKESLDRLSLLITNLPEGRKQIFEDEVLSMEATKQLILRLSPENHKTLKMIAAATGKNMTELVSEWIETTKKKLFGGDTRSSADKILEILSSPVDYSTPPRWTDEELDQMVEDDKLTPEEHAEIDASLKKRKAKK